MGTIAKYNVGTIESRVVSTVPYSPYVIDVETLNG